jgi:molybdopterin/thiamine biosynthesis adenylyltransferase
LPPEFDYHRAFARNLGWVTEAEQAILRAKRIAIAGLGGVGGSHVLTLTRLGIGAFNIADFDTFDLPNFNRQAGASLRHLGRPKAEVLAELATDINPGLDLRTFPQGVNRDNLDAFLDGVDLYVDSLDFFAVETRRMVFAACAEKGIPAITAAPLGMGTAFLAFMPGQMTFEEYFRMEGRPESEQLLRFLVGLSPAMLQLKYLAEKGRVNLDGHEGPSTAMACELCAGIAGVNALKILLNRGAVVAAPWGLHFDAYRNRSKKTWRPWGNNNPVQRLMLRIARRTLSPSGAAGATETQARPDTPIDRTLDLARWAPSGDNEQPWRFEVVSEDHFVVHARDTRDWCVYDLDGRASQIAVGALLETIAIAASAERLEARFTRRVDAPEEKPLIDVHLTPAPNLGAHKLLPFVKARVTQRRPFSTRPLTTAQKTALEASVGAGYRVIWVEGSRRRWQMAKLLFRSAHIRLTTREAWEVHRKNIEWGAQFSKDRLPAKAIGANPVTLFIMRWALQKWERVQWLNRWLAGTWPPRIEMDLVPGYFCGAHFLIAADKPLETIDDYIAGGRAVQRLWLTATSLALQFQPEMTPLIFSRYARQSLRFTDNDTCWNRALDIDEDLPRLFAAGNTQGLFMGRIGSGAQPASRSVRLAVSALRASHRLSSRRSVRDSGACETCGDVWYDQQQSTMSEMP